MSDAPQYSIVVPVGERVDELDKLVGAYLETLDSSTASYEIIVVFDGPNEVLLGPLRALVEVNERLRIIELSKPFGESAALMAGFGDAKGELLLTLPAYYQIDIPEIPRLLAALKPDDDMLIAVRWPRPSSLFHRLRRGVFHGVFKWISGLDYRDLGCGVRLLRRDVVAEVPLYGEQHRFFPALASTRGFRVREIELRQSRRDLFRGRYPTREYLHRFLDILTVFFLVRFTKKPLRFFGTLGFVAAGLGGIIVAILVVQRLFFGVGLADRPALLLGSLLVALGVQTFALGLIGELIIFTRAREIKDYAVRAVFGSDPPS